jgi:hypothetical protein
LQMRGKGAPLQQQQQHQRRRLEVQQMHSLLLPHLLLCR